MKVPTIALWMGTPINELEKPDLIEAIEYCGEEIARLNKEVERLRKAVDPIKYLMNV